MGRRSRRKIVGPVFHKLDQDHIRRLGVVKRPTLDYSGRRGAEASNIPSLDVTIACGPLVTKSVMDPMTLAKESPETRDAIIAKSKRIAIGYNKGAYQYVTDEMNPAELGSRSRR